jgi:lipopolysaccharide transport system permease protein
MNPEKPGLSGPQIKIVPTKGWVSLKLGELFAYRELLYFLMMRDIKVRYRQTLLGGLWAILQPFLTMVIFSIIFGRVAKMPSDGIPYPIFSYAALVPWTFFANGLTLASNSVVSSSNLVKKIYFPRLAIPIASILARTVDFAFSFAVLIVLMFYYGLTPTINIVWLPLLLLLAFVTSLGVSFWLSAMNVQYRDVKHTLPFLVQIWLFATPIVYPSSMLGEGWRIVYAVNPMVGVVEGFRWALLGLDTAPGPMIIVSSIMAVIVLISGAFYFRRMEKNFADII